MKFLFSNGMKKGFTLIELTIVVVIIAIISGVSLLSLSKYRNKSNLDSATRQISALLREAQSRSGAQESGVAWGVHFENATTSPFYALFSGTYNATSASTILEKYTLPNLISYTTSSISQGSYIEVSFAQVSGLPASSSSIGLVLLVRGATIASSTISVSQSGLIGY